MSPFGELKYWTHKKPPTTLFHNTQLEETYLFDKWIILASSIASSKIATDPLRDAQIWHHWALRVGQDATLALHEFNVLAYNIVCRVSITNWNHVTSRDSEEEFQEWYVPIPKQKRRMHWVWGCQRKRQCWGKSSQLKPWWPYLSHPIQK